MNRNTHNPSQNPFPPFEDGDVAPETSDRALVAFLKQHQPIAPPESANFEADLMAAIAQEPLPVATPRNRSGKRWRTIMGAIAAGLVGAVLGHNLGAWTSPGMRFADSSPGSSPETSPTNSPETELELFLETGWDGAIAQTDTTDTTDTSLFGWDTTDEM